MSEVTDLSHVPDVPYSTVVADPPWPYEDKEAFNLTIKKDGIRAKGAGIGTNYGSMTMEDLKLLPVEGLVATDAHVYVWTTNGFMEEAHDLVRAWGFKPKSILTWVKTHQDDRTRVSMKTGYYFRGATEHVIFGVRGSLRLKTMTGYPTGYLWPRIGKHSVKPAAFGDLVENCSPGPYLELFARAPRMGWDFWGKGFETNPGDQ